MKYLRALLLLAATASLVACQAAENVLRMPLNLAKSILSPVGRTVGLTSENARRQNDMHIEAREVHEAIAAAGKEDARSATAIADAIVAQR